VRSLKQVSLPLVSNRSICDTKHQAGKIPAGLTCAGQPGISEGVCKVNSRSGFNQSIKY